MVVMPNTTQHISAIAFDFGLKKIGVAVGQNLTNTARPLCILKAKNGIPNSLELENIIKTWRPNIIVVGIPKQENQPKQLTEILAEKFAQNLSDHYQDKYHFKIVTVDESFSSREAKQKFIELRQQNLMKQGEDFDHLAACVILERWFLSLQH